MGKTIVPCFGEELDEALTFVLEFLTRTVQGAPVTRCAEMAHKKIGRQCWLEVGNETWK